MHATKAHRARQAAKRARLRARNDWERRSERGTLDRLADRYAALAGLDPDDYEGRTRVFLATGTMLAQRTDMLAWRKAGEFVASSTHPEAG